MSSSDATYEAWGDALGPKDEQCIRVGLQNFGGFSRSKRRGSDEVEDSLRSWVVDGQFDAFGAPEANVYWPALHPNRSLNSRLNEWFENGTTKCSFSYNSTGQYQRSALQWGGVAQFTTQRLATRCTGMGRDDKNLGRWTWLRFQGSQNRVFYMYTAYRPVRGPGEFTTYQQQRQFYTQKTLTTGNPAWATKDPREEILQDLSAEIRRRHEEEEANVILVMDANQDVRSTRMANFAESAGLINALIHKHGGETMPSTCIKAGNRAKPIDGIFISEGIQVQRGGITEGGSGVCGKRADHRCLWIDIPFENLLGSPSVPLQRYPMRRVKTKDPRVVKKFNALYQQELQRHHLYERMFKLEQKATHDSLSQADLREAEKVDRLKMAALKYADKHCRRLCMGQVEHSPQVQLTRMNVFAYCLLVKKKLGGKVGSRKLQRTLAKAGLQTPLRTILQRSLETLLQERDNAFKAYWKAKKIAPRLRDQWIEELAQARALTIQSAKDIKVLTANELRRLRREEHRRQSARRVKFALHRGERQGTVMVSERLPTGEVIEHTTKEAIEACCMRENQRRFSQTNSTPPMNSPVLQEIGLLGDTAAAESILEGTYQPPQQMEPFSSRLLQELQATRYEANSQGISTREFQQGWKKMKEKTSAGPSLLHFGHMRAIAQHDNNSAFEASQMSFAMKSGYSFERWKKGIDVEILKKAGVWEASKLRTIVLFEADFNFINKVIGRRAMKHAEANNALAPEQYGSRKAHQASDHALNKWLTFDIVRQLKRPAAICSNDLKSCYDRIVHSIAALCLRRVGISRTETLTMFQTLQDLRHIIRTAYGDSRRTYGSPRGGKPFQGIFQGNGGGPPMWATISSPVMEAIRKLGFGASFQAAFSELLLEFLGYAFVDDTDLLESKGKDWHHTVNDMKEFVHHWEGLLRATGGALAPEKCAWWLLDFAWDDDGNMRYKTIQETPAELSVRDADDNPKTIPRKEAHHTFESLGVSQRPDGNPADEFNRLLQAAKEWGGKIRAARLPKEDVLYALKAFAMPKLMYGCSVVPLPETDCDKLTSKLLMTALPKAGFNRRFPRAIIHAPPDELGYSIPNLFFTSTASHLQTILRHGPSSSLSGQLLNASLEYAKVELGIRGNFFGYDYRRWNGLLTDCWLKRVWANLSKLPIMVEEGSRNCYTTHSHSVCIMEKLVAAGTPMSILQRINRCRLYLHAIQWTDLLNAEGNSLLPGVFSNHGDYARYGPVSANTWPNGPEPSVEDWRAWKKALKNKFHISNTGRLLVPIAGQWAAPNVLRSTAWFHTQSNLVIHTTNSNQWQGYSTTNRTLNGAKRLLRLEGLLTIEPSYEGGWLPCLVYHTHLRNTSIWVMETLSCAPPVPPCRPNGITLRRLLDELLIAPPHDSWMCQSVSLKGNLDQLVDNLRDGEVILSTDGSFKDGVGTGSFIVTTPDGANLLYGSNRAPGPAEAQCSLRSELAGICGGLRLVQLICALGSIENPSILISCDNLEAGHQSEAPVNQTIHPRKEHFDLRRALQLQRDRGFTRISTRFEHVRGHQDTETRWEELSLAAQLNCKADLLAKARWEEESGKRSYCGPLYEYEWRVSIADRPITSDAKNNIIRALATWNLHSWRTRKRKPEQAWTALWDTSTMRQAIFPFTPQHRFLTKLSADYLPVGHNMAKWRFWSHDLCPVCGAPDETRWHLFQCNDPRTQQTWTKELAAFMQVLRELQTAPFIQLALMSGLSRWRAQLAPAPPAGASGRAQNDMGWGQIFLGRIAAQWHDDQTQWSLDRSHLVRRKARTWLKHVIVAAHHFSFQMWLHRNAILHDGDQPFQQLRARAEDTDLRIAEEWMLGAATLMPLDRHLLQDRTIEDLLSHPPATRRRWLTLIQNSRDAFALQP